MNSLLGPCDYDYALDQKVREVYPNCSYWTLNEATRFDMKPGYKFIVIVWLNGEKNSKKLHLKCCHNDEKGYYFVSSLPSIAKNKEQKKEWFQDMAYMKNDEFYTLVKEFVSYDDIDQVDTWSFFGWSYADITKKSVTLRHKIAKNITANMVSMDEIKTLLEAPDLPTAYIASSRICNILPEICEQIYSETAGICKGVDGEQKVITYLNEYNYGEDRILDGIRLKIGENDFENDVIVINKSGVFTLEIKNYTKGILAVSNDGRVTHNGSIEDDVIMQSERHRNLLIKFLLEHGYDSEIASSIVHPIVVISNNTVEVDNRSDYPMIRLSLLSTYIHKNTYQLNMDKVNALYRLIKNNALKNYTHEYHTYSEIKPLINVLKRDELL
jgi:hypothetical protein